MATGDGAGAGGSLRDTEGGVRTAGGTAAGEVAGRGAGCGDGFDPVEGEVEGDEDEPLGFVGGGAAGVEEGFAAGMGIAGLVDGLPGAATCGGRTGWGSIEGTDWGTTTGGMGLGLR